jgi:hypothetical protein
MPDIEPEPEWLVDLRADVHGLARPRHAGVPTAAHATSLASANGIHAAGEITGRQLSPTIERRGVYVAPLGSRAELRSYLRKRPDEIQRMYGLDRRDCSSVVVISVHSDDACSEPRSMTTGGTEAIMADRVTLTPATRFAAIGRDKLLARYVANDAAASVLNPNKLAQVLFP